MNELIAKIEDVVVKLIKYDNQGYAEAAQELANDMINGFPTIVSYYADPRMRDHYEDAKYWPAQLERIINAFNAGDDLATCDILYNETRANLIELRDILKEKGII